MFANLVPKTGNEFGAYVLMGDLDIQGYKEMTLPFDGEHALEAVQEEVNTKKNYQTVVDNSPVGESRATGVVRHGLGMRLGMRISCKHPVVCCSIEHAGDDLSKYWVGENGKT